jgi:hypothetical protein
VKVRFNGALFALLHNGTGAVKTLEQYVEQAFATSAKLPLTGAALAMRARRLAAGDGVQFSESLRSAGLTFRKLVETTGLTVEDRPGRDFIVRSPDGTADAASAESPRRLREDIYRAFTRLRNTPLHYDSASERFIETGIGPILETIAIADALVPRRLFAEKQLPDVKSELLAALQEPKPLSAFAAKIRGRQLESEWYHFYSSYNETRAREWAASNQIEVPASWFADRPLPVKEDPRTILHALLALMNDDDVRRLVIPLRVVEAWAIERNRRY